MFYSKSIKTVIAIIFVITLTTAALFTFTGCGASKDGYISEVEDYLDFLASRNTNVSDFISDTYVSGSAFGSLYSGKKADELLEKYYQKLFELYSDEDYIFYDFDSYDTWEDFVSEAYIYDIYEEMNDCYGANWDMKYKIKSSEKLSADEISNVSFWGDFYEHAAETMTEFEMFDDAAEIEKFLKSVEDYEYGDIYKVLVDIKIRTGDEDDIGRNQYDATFIVAEIGSNWVILNGFEYPDLY